MKDTETPDKSLISRDQRISALAYQIWEEEGRPEGRAEVHWFLACQMVEAEDETEEPLPNWLSKQAEQAAATPPVTLATETRKKSAA